MELPTSINGLPLPSDLIVLIREGRWRCPADLSVLNQIFPERGDFMLYTLDTMIRENKDWGAENDPMFLGALDAVKAPGDIIPTLSVLIGDLGTGYDQPIALDYRLSMDSPRVLTLEWSEFAHNNRWIEVAPNILVFAEQIGL